MQVREPITHHYPLNEKVPLCPARVVGDQAAIYAQLWPAFKWLYNDHRLAVVDMYNIHHGFVLVVSKGADTYRLAMR